MILKDKKLLIGFFLLFLDFKALEGSHEKVIVLFTIVYFNNDSFYSNFFCQRPGANILEGGRIWDVFLFRFSSLSKNSDLGFL
ncbi:MAG: hypothetical protein CME68_10490 [Halobacteriovoraceae bacterium]|nr:hypothetical protein [Halobacteriovoraceae bacterium]